MSPKTICLERPHNDLQFCMASGGGVVFQDRFYSLNDNFCDWVFFVEPDIGWMWYNHNVILVISGCSSWYWSCLLTGTEISFCIHVRHSGSGRQTLKSRRHDINLRVLPWWPGMLWWASIPIMYIVAKWISFCFVCAMSTVVEWRNTNLMIDCFLQRILQWGPFITLLKTKPNSAVVPRPCWPYLDLHSRC